MSLIDKTQTNIFIDKFHRQILLHVVSHFSSVHNDYAKGISHLLFICLYFKRKIVKKNFFFGLESLSVYLFLAHMIHIIFRMYILIVIITITWTDLFIRRKKVSKFVIIDIYNFIEFSMVKNWAKFDNNNTVQQLAKKSHLNASSFLMIYCLKWRRLLICSRYFKCVKLMQNFLRKFSQNLRALALHKVFFY